MFYTVCSDFKTIQGVLSPLYQIISPSESRVRALLSILKLLSM